MCVCLCVCMCVCVVCLCVCVTGVCMSSTLSLHNTQLHQLSPYTLLFISSTRCLSSCAVCVCAGVDCPLCFRGGCVAMQSGRGWRGVSTRWRQWGRRAWQHVWCKSAVQRSSEPNTLCGGGGRIQVALSMRSSMTAGAVPAGPSVRGAGDIRRG